MHARRETKTRAGARADHVPGPSPCGSEFDKGNSSGLRTIEAIPVQMAQLPQRVAAHSLRLGGRELVQPAQRIFRRGAGNLRSRAGNRRRRLIAMATLEEAAW